MNLKLLKKRYNQLGGGHNTKIIAGNSSYDFLRDIPISINTLTESNSIQFLCRKIDTLQERIYIVEQKLKNLNL